MKQQLVFIFPHQLHAHNNLLDKNKTIVLLEHPRYFLDFKFHKLKLAFHRASMQNYAAILREKGYIVFYLECKDVKQYLHELVNKEIFVYDPVDHALESELQKLVTQNKCVVHMHESLLFLTSVDWIHRYVKNKKQFRMSSFYIAQRKRLGILLENGKPLGGKWSFDVQNREKVSQSLDIPQVTPRKPDVYEREAQEYVLKYFPQNPGSCDHLIYPTNSLHAKEWLDDFLTHKLAVFGTYQDAIIADEPYMFHSILSPLLNSGLLSVEYVLHETLNHAKKHSISLNNVEGFVRQIIGWREYVRAVYIVRGGDLRKSNFFRNKNELPKAFYTASTELNPLDDSIKKVLKYAYCHHIERLMVLGNSMLLMSVKPSQAYVWFMEMFIDAYDWVMVPNVYSMSQYADTSITTKPYISSSNYILKMSNYKKGKWSEIWDALFWSFLNKHKKKLASNIRMRFLFVQLSRKSSVQMVTYEKLKKTYIKRQK